MSRMTSVAWSLLAAGILVLAFSREANAYIDPGTGSLILQMVIAVVVGAGFAIRIFWKQIRLFLSHLFSKKRKTDLEDDPH